MRFSNSFNGFGLDSQMSCSPTNILKTDKGYSFEFVVPGFSKEELDLEVKEGQLLLKASKNKEEKTEKIRFSQRQFGLENVVKRFRLPEDADAAAMTAVLENGILAVDLPFDAQKHVVRKVSIN